MSTSARELTADESPAEEVSGDEAVTLTRTDDFDKREVHFEVSGKPWLAEQPNWPGRPDAPSRWMVLPREVEISYFRSDGENGGAWTLATVIVRGPHRFMPQEGLPEGMADQTFPSYMPASWSWGPCSTLSILRASQDLPKWLRVLAVNNRPNR